MRWPLRLQIMLPMAAIMLLTVLVVGGLGAYLAACDTKARIDSQVAGVMQILAESNFPLTDKYSGIELSGRSAGFARSAPNHTAEETGRAQIH